ncbi:MAG: hypothetical protein JNM67_10240, partial [Bacteroidetes bacterium]|nr:hypothetical protein [Bacteroidota bacterium]
TPLNLNYAQSSTTEAERILVIPPHSKKILKTYKFLEVIKHCDLGLNKDSVALEYTTQNSPLNFSNIFYYKVNSNEHLNEIRNDFYLSKVIQLDYKKVWVQKNKFYPCTDRPNGYYYSVSPYEASNRLYFRLRSDL